MPEIEPPTEPPNTHRCAVCGSVDGACYHEDEQLGEAPITEENTTTATGREILNTLQRSEEDRMDAFRYALGALPRTAPRDIRFRDGSSIVFHSGRRAGRSEYMRRLTELIARTPPRITIPVGDLTLLEELQRLDADVRRYFGPNTLRTPTQSGAALTASDIQRAANTLRRNAMPAFQYLDPVVPRRSDYIEHLGTLIGPITKRNFTRRADGKIRLLNMRMAMFTIKDGNDAPYGIVEKPPYDLGLTAPSSPPVD